jgi:peptidoglycan/LPS O-acetylase OafA/YrhL
MKQPKLLGIELIRGLSTYAVVLVHSGDQTWGLPIDSSAIQFRLFFYFAVPFFLAVAFYFMTAKPEIVYSAKFWRSKVERILIPYAVWTGIFFIFRVILFTSAHQFARLQQLLQDPLSIIFFGAASYHLYFLPMLLTGTLLVLLMPLFKILKINIFGILLFAILSVTGYVLLKVSGNAFQLSEMSTAFQGLTDSLKIDIHRYPLLRFISVESAWTIGCLPYFSIAMLLNKMHLNQKLFNTKTSFTLGLALLFVLFDTFGKTLLVGGLSEILLAFSLLLFGISISRYFSSNTSINIVSSIGFCSFGIYLIHPFVMYIVKFIIGKTIPQIVGSVSICSMLIISVPCFAISWAIVAYLTRAKLKTNYLFGV